MFGKMLKAIKKFFKSNVEMCYKDHTKECPSKIISVGTSLYRVGATQCCKHTEQFKKHKKVDTCGWSNWAKVRHEIMEKAKK